MKHKQIKVIGFLLLIVIFSFTENILRFPLIFSIGFIIGMFISKFEDLENKLKVKND